MPSAIDAIPRTAYDAYKVLGDARERRIGGGMWLFRPAPLDSIDLWWVDRALIRYTESGTVRICPYKLTRGEVTRMRVVLPPGWSIEPNEWRRDVGCYGQAKLVYRRWYYVWLYKWAEFTSTGIRTYDNDYGTRYGDLDVWVADAASDMSDDLRRDHRLLRTSSIRRRPRPRPFAPRPRRRASPAPAIPVDPEPMRREVRCVCGRWHDERDRLPGEADSYTPPYMTYDEAIDISGLADIISDPRPLTFEPDSDLSAASTVVDTPHISERFTRARESLALEA